MSETAQDRASRTYRERLRRRGLKRHDIMAPERDGALLRRLGRRLAEGGDAAERARAAMQAAVQDEAAEVGGILEALRRSPLVGADIDFQRSRSSGRDIDL